MFQNVRYWRYYLFEAIIVIIRPDVRHDLHQPDFLKLYKESSFNLNSSVGSDEEPQDLDGERHEDFEGHIRG
jgi:hypothetical protein